MTLRRSASQYSRFSAGRSARAPSPRGCASGASILSTVFFRAIHRPPLPVISPDFLRSPPEVLRFSRRFAMPPPPDVRRARLRHPAQLFGFLAPRIPFQRFKAPFSSQIGAPPASQATCTAPGPGKDPQRAGPSERSSGRGARQRQAEPPERQPPNAAIPARAAGAYQVQMTPDPRPEFASGHGKRQRPNRDTASMMIIRQDWWGLQGDKSGHLWSKPDNVGHHRRAKKSLASSRQITDASSSRRIVRRLTRQSSATRSCVWPLR